jgi:uncharacterized membrane protein
MREAENIAKIPRSTLKLRLNTLLKNGLIKRMGVGRGTWYTLHNPEFLA